MCLKSLMLLLFYLAFQEWTLDFVEEKPNSDKYNKTDVNNSEFNPFLSPGHLFEVFWFPPNVVRRI